MPSTDVTEFTTPGEHQFDVTWRHRRLYLELDGGSGTGGHNATNQDITSTSPGATGGAITAELDVENAATAYAYVAGAASGQTGGFNGGGDGGEFDTGTTNAPTATGGGGGGASDIRIDGTTLADRALIAAGGGGGGAASADGTANSGSGGAGGADTGADGVDGNTSSSDVDTASGGTGGTQSDGYEQGAGGPGGSRGSEGSDGHAAGGGGAGSGYWGGTGGGVDGVTDFVAGDSHGGAGGGAGGSNYADTTVAASVSSTRGANSGDGRVRIEFTYPDPASNLTATTQDGTFSLSWDASPDAVDGYSIFRSAGDPVDPETDHLVDVGSSTTTYTDDDSFDPAETYYYAVAAYDADGSSTTIEDSDTTTIQAPTNFTATTVDDDSLEYTWTLQSTAEGGVRVYRKLAADTSFQQVADLPAGTESYTDTGLLDGRTYDAYVEVYSQGVSAASGEGSATTSLPDVDGYVLNASIQDELLAESISPAIDNGQYRVRWKRSVDGSYPAGNEATIPYDTDPRDYTISPVLDGEEYDVGIRSETSDATGAWHTASEITKLVAADGLAFEAINEQGVTLTWLANSNFDGSYQIYRTRDDYDTGFELIGSVADTATEYVDDGTLVPERPYSYYIRSVTQYVNADSPEASVETASAGHEQSPIPPQGWYVEIDHPSGTTLKPQILDDAQHRPQLNGPSEVEVPVPGSETWLNESLDDQAMRVYHDGNRLPIDRLADREDETDHVLLHGAGPSALERTVRADVDVEPAHELAQRLIEDNTDLIANVDSPTSAEEDTLMQAADASDGWSFSTEDTDLTAAPFEIVDGRLHLQQTCFTRHAITRDSDTAFVYDIGVADAVNGERFGIGANSHSMTWEVEVPYRIPEEYVGVSIRVVDLDDGYPVRFLLNGQEIESFVDQFSSGPNTWLELAEGVYTGPGWSGGDIAAGETVSFTIEGDGSGDGTFSFDAVTVIHDTRFNYNFDTELHEPQGHLDGPEHYPVASLELDAAESILSVVGGSLVADFDDTSGAQSVGIRNALGNDYTTASNAETVETDFDDAGAFIQTQLTLSRYGQRDDATPRMGYQGQTVGSFELSATLEDTPLIIGQTLEGDLDEQLAEIAEQTNSIYEPAVNSAGEFTIEWTQPGERTTDEQPDVVDYSTRRVTDKVQRAVISGAAIEVREEAFTADGGSDVELDNGEVVPHSERVYDDSGTEYERDADYQIDRQAGTITVLSGGSLSDGTEVNIDYEHKVRGSFESGEYNGDTRFELRETIPQLTTTRACALAAKVLVDEQSEARWEADVTFPPSIPADLSLVEAIDLEEMPGDAMAIYELTESPTGLEARLGEQNRVRNRLTQLQRQADAISQRI